MNALNLSRLNALSPYMENFIAIIVPRQHPYLEEIVSRYNAEIEMFKTSK